ncbi:XdhC family protein [Thermoactinospora rubra]|uniref:XdhC family protein n=1 Tax=Thermoactinospora rubra TaxID=1088767 RepID=UPI000A1128BC|nr:XdhC/CoxI family protein [Thermoactinospora rubra]
MREIAGELRGWLAEGRRFAVASVTAVSGSAPREAGAALAVAEDGTAVGSVSGGCVEGAVYELCLQALQGGRPVRQTFGYSDTDAFAVGLTCGGVVEVLVWPVQVRQAAVVDAYLEAVLAGEPVALARVLPGEPGSPGSPGSLSSSGSRTGVVAVWADRHAGSLGEDELDPVVVAEARAMLEAGRTGPRELGCDERRAEVFVETHTPPPRLLVFGAIDFAAALARAGRFLGYHVTVCDARPVFATAARFPDAHEVVVDWPHRYLERTRVDARTVIAVLTHDAKFDIPVLARALRSPACYVGAMGSRRTHEDRMRRLRATGLDEAELARLRSPIGLDLGARTPEETALSIAAEFVALRRGGSGLPLSATSGPIHARTTARMRMAG